MQRKTENLDGTWKKLSDGACHVQIRGGSGRAKFIPQAATVPDLDDDTYQHFAEIDWPGPEPLYAMELEGGEIASVWEDA